MIYDVSMPLRDGMPLYTGSVPFRRTLRREIAKGASSNESLLELSAHTGTHIDGPAHFLPGGAGVETVAPEVLLGPARLLHFPDHDAVDRKDLEALDLAGVKRILLRTRNSERWARGEGFDERAVYLTGPGADLLVERGVRLVGTDGLGIEKFRSPDHPAHTVLLNAGVTILEGLCLAGVPAGDYILFCGPLRIEGSDGAPARVFLVDPSDLR